MQEYQGFDLERMFIGEFSPVLLAEIAVRTVVMYVYALAVVRFIGKRGLGQVTPFEFVIVIALGSATGDPMFYRSWAAATRRCSISSTASRRC
jgi:hypothetical protein